MHDTELDEMIDQWVRTVRSGRVIHCCGSAEGQYRPRLGEIEIDDPQIAEPIPRRIHAPLSVRIGWKMEAAWRSIPMARTRLLLSWYYVRNRSLPEAARRAKVERQKAERELREGRAFLWLSVGRAL